MVLIGVVVLPWIAETRESRCFPALRFALPLMDWPIGIHTLSVFAYRDAVGCSGFKMDRCLFCEEPNRTEPQSVNLFSLVVCHNVGERESF